MGPFELQNIREFFALLISSKQGGRISWNFWDMFDLVLKPKPTNISNGVDSEELTNLRPLSPNCYFTK